MHKYTLQFTKSEKTRRYELTIRKIHKSCWKADRRLQMVEAPHGELVLPHDVFTYLVMTILTSLIHTGSSRKKEKSKTVLMGRG